MVTVTINSFSYHPIEKSFSSGRSKNATLTVTVSVVPEFDSQIEVNVCNSTNKMRINSRTFVALFYRMFGHVCTNYHLS